MVVEEVLLSTALSSLPTKRYLVLDLQETSRLVTLTVELLANQAKEEVTPVAATMANAAIPPRIVFFLRLVMVFFVSTSLDVDKYQHISYSDRDNHKKNDMDCNTNLPIKVVLYTQ